MRRERFINLVFYGNGLVLETGQTDTDTPRTGSLEGKQDYHMTAFRKSSVSTLLVFPPAHMLTVQAV